MKKITTTKIRDMINSIRTNKTLQSYLLSGLFASGLTIHLISSDIVIAGKTNNQTPPAVKTTQTEPAKPTAVKIKQVDAVVIDKELLLYGRTEPNRIATIRAEFPSTVDNILFPKGKLVEKNAIIVQLDTINLKQQLQHAKALYRQRELEYTSAKKMEKNGFQAALIVADKATQFAQAKAALADLEIQLGYTSIQTPYKGVLNHTHVEIGDYLKEGETVAEILELNPLIIKIFVPETHVQDIALGQLAEVSLLNGESHQGKVRYIAANSVAGTNTFTVEVVLDNPDYKIPAGISSKVTLQTEQLLATPISPSFLALNDQGQSGIYIVKNNKALFKKANIVKSNAEQMWVETLGDRAQIIIAGHQSILNGSAVNVLNPPEPDAHQYLSDQVLGQSL